MSGRHSKHGWGSSHASSHDRKMTSFETGRCLELYRVCVCVNVCVHMKVLWLALVGQDTYSNVRAERCIRLLLKS
jgi:hypothetical protein